MTRVDPLRTAPLRVRRKFRAWLALPAGIALISIIWAAVALTVSNVHFILLDPKTKTGFEVFLAVHILFVALVLILFPDEAMREAMRWVGLGFMILGLGSLGFGYLYPVLADPLSLPEGMYGSLLIRTIAAAALAVGLALPRAPRLTRSGFFALIAVAAALNPLRGQVAAVGVHHEELEAESDADLPVVGRLVPLRVGGGLGPVGRPRDGRCVGFVTVSLLSFSLATI